MVDVDTLGRAIHAAKRVGGPWGPACHAWQVHPDFPGGTVTGFFPCEYDYNSGEYECECKSMAAHLIELMEA